MELTRTSLASNGGAPTTTAPFTARFQGIHFRQRVVEIHHDRLRVRFQATSIFRRPHAARVAIKKPQSEFVFQAPEIFGQGRLRHVQMFGRLAEAAGL
jgi:hypothetical protein